MDQEEKTTSSYNKRPLWQWVVIYLIIGAIIYGLIYYFVLGGNLGGNSGINYTYPGQ